MNEYEKYAAQLKAEDQQTARDWHERNGLPVSVERYGWEGRNYDSPEYIAWMSGTARGDGVERIRNR